VAEQARLYWILIDAPLLAITTFSRRNSFPDRQTIRAWADLRAELPLVLSADTLRQRILSGGSAKRQKQRQKNPLLPVGKRGAFG
jgi:hypothetical protein